MIVNINDAVGIYNTYFMKFKQVNAFALNVVIVAKYGYIPNVNGKWDTSTAMVMR